MKGRKARVKYRDKEGNTCRARCPARMAAREAKGWREAREDFAVEKTAASRKASPRKAKKRRRKK